MTITYRPGITDDLDTYYDLYRYEHIESYGNFGLTKEDAEQEWYLPYFDLSKHSMYAFDGDRMVGYAELRWWKAVPVRPSLYAYVHPDYRGQGIGSHLTEWGIKAAEQVFPLVPDDARVVLQGSTNLDDGMQLLENFGFIKERESHIMGMDLRDDMPEPCFPEGFELVSLSEYPNLEDFVYVQTTAFKDHRGTVDEPLEQSVKKWQKMIDQGRYSPENFMLLRDGDENAAIIFFSDKSDENPDQLWVESLGTLPDYRGRGLAKNLLYYAHQQAMNKGKSRMALSVDGSSLTGANKLYEKVGMGVDMIYAVYGHEIRPGIELTKQS